MDGERNLKTRVTVLAFIVLGLVSRARATDVYWTGAAVESNSWCEPNNWAGPVVPEPCDSAYIDLAALPCAVIEPNSSAGCYHLTVGKTAATCCLDITGGSLTVGKNFVIGEEVGSAGEISMSGGTVNVADELVLGINGTAMMHLDGGRVNVGGLDIGSSGLVDINDGTLIIEGYALEDVWAYVDAGRLTGYGSPQGVVADFDQSNPYKTTVTANADFDPGQAWNPRPFDTAVFVDLDVTLTWFAGADLGYGRHHIYFGTDAAAVEAATESDPEYMGVNRAVDTVFDIGALLSWATYYWRIDEVGVATAKGRVWSFTTRPVFVDASATGANNGSSWEDAYKYLQDALADPSLASGRGAIWVAEGTYKPDANTANPVGTSERAATFQVINGVAIYAGYAGYWAPDPNERDVELYETILSGDINTPGDNSDNSYHVVTSIGTNATSILDGFTITAGNASGSWPSSTALGGGMLNMSNSSHRITNCTFSRNSAESGSGMWNDFSSPTVTNCTFSRNSARANGGGMFNWGSNSTVINCTFSGNSANSGAGMLNNVGSSPTLTNCTFTGNLAESTGGGIYNMNSNPTVTNCTFSGNSAGSEGGGMYNFGWDLTVRNCVLWGNSAPSGPEIFNIDSTPGVTYSDVAGGYAGTGNINADPLFIDANGLDGMPGTADDEEGYVHLRGYSPCINAGNPAGDYSGQVDIDAQPRVAYGRVDMGADEVFPAAGDYEPDGDVDFADFARSCQNWLLGGQ